MTKNSTNNTKAHTTLKADESLKVAQKPDSARYDGMPRSAIATGLVDLILEAEKIPARLIQFASHIPLMEIANDKDRLSTASHDHFNQIFTLLYDCTGHDFSGYKKNTFIRRLQRRLTVCQLENIAGYVDYMCEHPAEDLDKIFRMFEQSSDQDIWVSGTGIGLAISKEIVERHGGNIYVQSPPENTDHGSAFILEIPLNQ